MKEQLFNADARQQNAPCDIAEIISNYGACLEKNGFQVHEEGDGMATSLHAEYQSLCGGPTICFCYECEVFSVGRVCGAAVAVKNTLGEKQPFKLVVCAMTDEFGNVDSGTNEMLIKKCVNEPDLVLLVCGGRDNVLEENSMVSQTYEFEYRGISSHPGAHPENGRPAWDAFQLAIHGLNFLRPHLPFGSQLLWAMNGSERPDGGDFNTITKGTLSICTQCASQFNDVIERVINVLEGAAIMTETKVSFVSRQRKIIYRPCVPPFDCQIDSGPKSNGSCSTIADDGKPIANTIYDFLVNEY